MRFQCPFCQGIVAVDNTRIGQDVQCGHCDEVITVPAARLASGAIIADFIIMEEIGRGGMGVVYMAHQISLDRPAALKILQDNYASNAEFVVNFIKEARCAAKLNHPHIVQAYAVGEDEGIFYFAMEFIDGETMKSVLKREKIIAIDKAVAIIQQIAEALDCAWKEQKLIHRDIKPDNIMLTRNGRAKLADLGLSRVAGEVDDEDEGDEVMGTPQYISPEHLTGAPMDVRSDIYSLGATFYQFVTGRFPYEGKNANEIAKQHLDGTLIPPQQVNPQVPETIGQIIIKMMKKNPAERYQDAEALVEDLRIFRRGKVPSSLSMPKVFSTRTRSVSRTELHLPVSPGQAPAVQPPEVPTTTTGSLKPLYTATTTTSSGLIFSGKAEEELHTEPKKKAFAWLILVIAVIVLISGAAIWFFVIPQLKSSKPAVKAPPVAQPVKQVSPEEKKKMRDPEYCAKIDELLLAPRNSPEDAVKFLTGTDEFFEKYPQPETEVQRDKLKALIQVYSPLDEKNRVAANRKKLRDAHIQEIQRNKNASEIAVAEQRRQDELKKRRDAEDLERRRKLDEEKKKQEQRIADYSKSIKNKMITLAMTFVRCGNSIDPAAADTAFTEAISEPGKMVGRSAREREEATKLADYARKLQAGFSTGKKMSDLVNNSGTELDGTQIELRSGALGKIKKIEDGTMTIKMLSSDSTEEIKISELQGFFLNKFLQRLEKKQLIANGFFFYMLYSCNFYPELSASAPDEFWKKELPNLEFVYFKEKLRNAPESERKALEARFGALESFKKAMTAIPKT
jgi:serine/threonine protein kinase